MRSTDGRRELRHAIGEREAARARLRRATGGAVAVAVALGGVFAALAAGATHPKKTVAPSTSAKRVPARRGAVAGRLAVVRRAERVVGARIRADAVV
jgi:esterase/lipase